MQTNVNYFNLIYRSLFSIYATDLKTLYQFTFGAIGSKLFRMVTLLYIRKYKYLVFFNSRGYVHICIHISQHS